MSTQNVPLPGTTAPRKSFVLKCGALYVGRTGSASRVSDLAKAALFSDEAARAALTKLLAPQARYKLPWQMIPADGEAQ